MDKYKRLNIYTGWLMFIIAAAVFLMTAESTASLWDCGEYITAAYKLEVGHPPGAPFFMIVGRLFSFLASPDHVAVAINSMSALSSAGAILFMFWSITMLVKKMIFKQYGKRELTTGEIIAIIGSGVVGSLAYTFTDTFWFSAVEGEVYAMSSLFTAVIFWAILKWDEEMEAIEFKELTPDQNSGKWLLLIMFMFGLAIGVHLLGLLVVPAITYVIYFRHVKKITFKNFFLVGILSIAILGGIQNGVIPGTVALASDFEIFFVNDLGMPFFSGAIFFVIFCVAAFIFLIRYANKKHKPILHMSVLGLLVLLMGYGAFALIVIRSNADTPLDENDPENLVTLHSYLMREQYGTWPLVTGPYWNSKKNDVSLYGDGNPKYIRRYVVNDGSNDIKAFKYEKDAQRFVDSTKQGYDIDEKYYIQNKDFLKHSEPTYQQTTIFPRMWDGSNPSKVDGYKQWSGYDPTDVTDADQIGDDGLRLPRFSENLRFFFNYQVDWMYWRYFMWNFAGRQNDIQGHGDQMRGNWISGVQTIDQMRLGAQGVNAPSFTQNNLAHNRLFFLPLILGLIGLIFHFYRSPKDAFVILMVFLLTGIAIIVYLNQRPLEPRERDYAYVASFYAFALWIGIAVYALFDIFRNFGKAEIKKTGYIILGGAAIFGIAGLGSESGFASLAAWLFISFVSVLLIVLMFVFRKLKLGEKQVAIAVGILTLFVPILMGSQEWNDHNRHNKTTARDLAHNYLEPCLPNAIIFTNGDNDTFPLWYYQEVEGKRTDVRVCNLSLLGTDWYTEQMKRRAYESAPLPIKFTSDQILSFAGGTEQVFLHDLYTLTLMEISPDNFARYYNLKYKYNADKMKADYANTLAAYRQKFATMTIKQNNARISSLQQTLNNLNPDDASAQNVFAMFTSFRNLAECLRDGSLVDPSQDNKTAISIQQSLQDFEKVPNSLPLDVAMAFARDDKNMIQTPSYGALRVIPANHFTLKVNKDNVVKSGLVSEKNRSEIADEVNFSIDKQYITKEQVMMLDILANNDWKRPIYFSSHYGSDVSRSLFENGFVKQIGVQFELLPVKGIYTAGVDTDRMYNDLMNVYSYGMMYSPKVMTDYYARRHTSQYRNNFSRLADYLVSVAENDENKIQSFTNFINTNSGATQQYKDSLQKEISRMKAEIPENKKKAIALVKKSLEVMPIGIVLDYGEPNQIRPLQIGGQQISNYSDGTLHDLVTILYRAGDKVDGNKVGNQVFTIVKQNINYFMKSKPTMIYYNKGDLISALNALFKMDMVINDKEIGEPNSALAKEMTNYISELSTKEYPAKLAELKDIADNASDEYSAVYEKAYNDMKALLPALMSSYGYQVAGAPGNSAPAPNQNLTPEQIQQLINQQ